jgi:mono/diheme cytochrome c family protein
MWPVTRPSRINRFALAVAIRWVVIFSARTLAQVRASSDKKANNDSLPAGVPGVVARGFIVYKDRCAICHFGESDVRKVGSGLKGIYKRGKFADGGKVDDTSMENRILNGGKDMPPFKAVLSPGQIRDLILYLRTL